jgi:AcrR family transcriptional regulator
MALPGMTGAMTVSAAKPARARRPQRYDGADNRRAVLDAALTVFADRGFEAASTRAIAAAAGLEQGHLAYYFPSKAALWQQVVEAFAREGEEVLRGLLAGDDLADPARTARAVLPALLRVFARNPRLTRLMLQEFSVGSPRHQWVVDTFGAPVWRLLEPLFGALRDKGLLSGAPPAVAYFNLVGAALITFGNQALILRLAGCDTAEPGTVDAVIAYILGPVLAPAPALPLKT